MHSRRPTELHVREEVHQQTGGSEGETRFLVPRVKQVVVTVEDPHAELHTRSRVCVRDLPQESGADGEDQHRDIHGPNTQTESQTCHQTMETTAHSHSQRVHGILTRRSASCLTSVSIYEYKGRVFVIREKEEAKHGHNISDYIALEMECRMEVLNSLYNTRSKNQIQQLVGYFDLIEKTMVTDSEKINTKRIL